MKAIICTEQHFFEYDNKIYTETVGSYSFWRRYLDAFSSIIVVARVSRVSILPKSILRADGKAVVFHCLPDYVGPKNCLKKLPALFRQTKNLAHTHAAFILRVPGTVGTLLYWWLRLKNWPFSLEVVGDPYDSLNPNALKTKWASLFRPLATWALKNQTKKAVCTAYVTRKYLQQRYPPGRGFTTYYSSAELPAELFQFTKIYSKQTKYRYNKNSLKILNMAFIGSMAQRYKGLDVLLYAMARCAQKGFNLRLTALGDGKYRPEYEELAHQLGLKEKIFFGGYIPHGREVWNHLCRADLFRKKRHVSSR